MLARIAHISGVLEARVDSSGTYLFLAIDEVEVDDALAEARLILGDRARAVSEEEGTAQVDERRRGERWFGDGEMLSLSWIEARILAQRLADVAAGAGAIEKREGRRFAESARRVLARWFERVHAEGGRPSTEWFFVEWPAIAQAILHACEWVGEARRRPLQLALAGAFPNKPASS